VKTWRDYRVWIKIMEGTIVRIVTGRLMSFYGLSILVVRIQVIGTGSVGLAERQFKSGILFVPI
jgi:hypothetical protein